MNAVLGIYARTLQKHHQSDGTGRAACPTQPPHNIAALYEIAPNV
jgi:hypothetical protein